MSFSKHIENVDDLEEEQSGEEAVVVGDQSVRQVERENDLEDIQEMFFSDEDADDGKSELQNELFGVDVGRGGRELDADSGDYDHVNDLEVGGQDIEDL